jgi:hypothetical protein
LRKNRLRGRGLSSREPINRSAVRISVIQRLGSPAFSCFVPVVLSGARQLVTPLGNQLFTPLPSSA